MARSIESIKEEFSVPVQTKIQEVENDGKSFLSNLNRFSDSDIVDISKNESLRTYMINTIMNSKEDSVELQAVCSSLYYCLGSRSNDIMSFVVSLSSYVLYSYMRSYSQSHTLLSLEICLQKIVYIESLVTIKKSQEPSILFSSIYHEVTSNGQPHNLTSDNLEQYQRILNTNRIEVPSPIKGMTDNYTTYIIATLSLQFRYLPFMIKYQDTFLSLYRILLGAKDVEGEFSLIEVYSPLSDAAVFRICEILKAFRCMSGESFLWKKCVTDVKNLSSLSHSESVIISSLLL
ncbi:hypothetical protein WA171_000541 [Blastocystis sp. BT1]